MLIFAHEYFLDGTTIEERVTSEDNITYCHMLFIDGVKVATTYDEDEFDRILKEALGIKYNF